MYIVNKNPVTVNDLVASLQQVLLRKAMIGYLPIQPGVVENTYADITLISQYCNFQPQINLLIGLNNFFQC
jgi:UDP-glucuronate 4-epimerase